MPTNTKRPQVPAVAALEHLRALGDPVRWQIVRLLAHEQLCVCHLSDELGIRQPLVSHHVRVLRDAGLIEGHRFRYWTYYRLRPETLAALAEHLRDLAATAPVDEHQRRPCC